MVYKITLLETGDHIKYLNIKTIVKCEYVDSDAKIITKRYLDYIRKWYMVANNGSQPITFTISQYY